MENRCNRKRRSQVPWVAFELLGPPLTCHQKNDVSCDQLRLNVQYPVYPKKYAHGFCFVVLCCGYTLIDFAISTRLTSLALGQSNDCPSASKATLMNMDKCPRTGGWSNDKTRAMVIYRVTIARVLTLLQPPVVLFCSQFLSIDF